jgi:hypothetical protein
LFTFSYFTYKSIKANCSHSKGDSSIIKLNFDLNQSSNVVNDFSIWGIYFDLCDKNLYIASWSGQSIFIYHTNDEITFNKIDTIITSYDLISITINYDKIYTGTGDGAILVFNKTNNALIKTMDNLCSNFIESVKYECNGDMFYSCDNPPKLKVIGTNGINSTLFLNEFFTAHEAYIDLKNRLWIGGNNGFVIYI